MGSVLKAPEKEWTKDGRKWYFRQTYYIDDKRHEYKSKKYKTREEAKIQLILFNSKEKDNDIQNLLKKIDEAIVECNRRIAKIETIKEILYKTKSVKGSDGIV